MMVLIANDLPPAVRGRLKLWFIEPKPNVFISGITGNVARNITDYLIKKCSKDAGLVIFRSTSKTPYYRINIVGNSSKSIITFHDLLDLIIEKN